MLLSLTLQTRYNTHSPLYILSQKKKKIKIRGREKALERDVTHKITKIKIMKIEHMNEKHTGKINK